jgi:cholest-5-ene-3beta,7alpha-diol 3beta-dehydrogenase
MKKRVLLTGASGAVGFEAFKELLRRSDRYLPRVLALNTPSEQKFFQPYAHQAEFVWGDLRDPKDVARAVAGTDVVLHVGAIIPPLADHRPELAQAVNLGGTRNVIAAIQKQNSPPKLIYTSSISVYGDRVKTPNIRVGDPLNPSLGDQYAVTKIVAEAAIRDANLEHTILRLCGILTPRLKIQPLMFHMPLDTALEWCHASDAGLALVNAIENESVNGGIFNLGGGERCRIRAREFLRVMLPLFGLDPLVIPEYAFALKNFHSGYYADGDEVEESLQFRRKTLCDYFESARKSISPWQRLGIRSVPKPIVRAYLERMSAPLQAIKACNLQLIARFYGSREAFERLLNPRQRKVFAG